MKVLVLDTSEKQRLLRRRRALGIDKPDEVWNNTYIVFPPQDNQHQHLRGKLAFSIMAILEKA